MIEPRPAQAPADVDRSGAFGSMQLAEVMEARRTAAIEQGKRWRKASTWADPRTAQGSELARADRASLALLYSARGLERLARDIVALDCMSRRAGALA